MNDNEILSKAEVARRITVGMGLVYDLYNEVVSLLRVVKECVESSVVANCLTGGTFKIPVASPKNRTPADIYMDTDLGMVYELDTQGVSGDDDDDESDEGEDASKKGMRVTADSRFLVFRVQLYDRNHSGGDDFQPCVLGAVLSDLVRTKVVKGRESEELRDFSIRRAAFLKILRKLDGATTVDQPISVRVPKGKITGTATVLQVQPLADFDSEQSVSAFVQQLLPNE